jgi:hypothetical protein
LASILEDKNHLDGQVNGKHGSYEELVLDAIVCDVYVHGSTVNRIKALDIGFSQFIETVIGFSHLLSLS